MIGALRHRITIQQSVRVADGGGGFSQTWQDVPDTPTVYAAIEQLSGGEKAQLSQLGTAITHRITLRYRSDLTAAMRIVKDDMIYKIISLQDRAGQGRRLEVLAAAQVP